MLDGKLYVVVEHLNVKRIANELTVCRQRGLDRLDHQGGGLRKVKAPALERLAEEYTAVEGLTATGRSAQIKLLLRDGINEFNRQGHTDAADLLRDLLFGESMDVQIKAPGVLLDKARKKVNESESRFRARRANIMISFAQFLISFVVPEADEVVVGDIAEGDEQLVTTGFVATGHHFVQLLAEAVRITIVGITNQQLAPMLEEALRLKRESSRGDANWDSVRIVFLGEDLLAAVNDKREQLQNSQEALRQRRLERAWAQSAIGNFLKRNQPRHWAMFECSFVPPLTGALLDFGERKAVHLLIRGLRLARADQLYIDLEDPFDRFSIIFDGIVQYSTKIEMIVPVGRSYNGIFECRSARLHVDVLKDGSGAVGVLPMVLVITPRRRGDQVEPMLQLRTQQNSARELYRLSHLAGHILQNDRVQPGGRLAASTTNSFGCNDDAPRSAAQRIAQEATGDDFEGKIEPVATGSYLHSDKEDLLFFVFLLDPREEIQFRRSAEMHPFPLSELLNIRANRVLSSAAQLCRAQGVAKSAWTAAVEVMSLNLRLHDSSDLAERLEAMTDRVPAELDSLASDFEQAMTKHEVRIWTSTGSDISVSGLAGWQHREFFSMLLPQYAKIGINGAGDLLQAVNGDKLKSVAVDRLAEMYKDHDYMDRMPIEV